MSLKGIVVMNTKIKYKPNHRKYGDIYLNIGKYLSFYVNFLLL